ncbi:MAG: hypothetical protein M3N52_09955, partial [Actinomycetota bacterium]|nr:hypothetical protein [Actinomycetota bacterium]
MTASGLYHPHAERDACGIGFVANVDGASSRQIVEAAIEGLCGVKHRGAAGADARSGDGAGLLLPLPRALLAEAAGRQLTRSGSPAAGQRAVSDDGDAVPAERIGVAMCFLDGRE